MQATLEKITCGALTYTLSCLEDTYTITITYQDVSKTLPRFTRDASTAHTFFPLIAEHEVSPYHLHDIWEDYNK